MGQLPFDIQPQPDDSTCGPTCLHAVYTYYGDEVPLQELVQHVPELEAGGTLGVLLAHHALGRGYRVTLVTWNLHVFDPTWFAPGAPPLVECLARRWAERDEPKLRFATKAYQEFLERGGRIEFADLKPALLRRALRRRIPILTGLSATYLYREARQRLEDNEPDDITGDPVGHFVVLTGYVKKHRQVVVSDPLHPNPLSSSDTYLVPIERVIGAIYLGVLTYDANLILIEPARQSQAER